MPQKNTTSTTRSEFTTARMPRVLLSAVFLSTFVAFGCGRTAAPKDTRAEDEATIRAYSQGLNEAVRAQNVEKTLSFYTDDALSFSDDGPTTTTKEAQREDMQKGFSVPGWTITWKTDTVVVSRSGDLAYEHGRYTYTGTEKDGKPNTHMGNYLLVWKKPAGGDWKIAVDTDSQDPIAAATK
jgi:uncharacterized protein (TIGR02246 family)